MKTYSLIFALLLSLFFLVSCGSESDTGTSSPETTEPSSESTPSSDLIETPTETPTQKPGPFFEMGSYNGIIVGSGVRSRSKPSTDGDVVRSFETGELVLIKDRNLEREILTSGDACDDYGYEWYQVEDTKGEESWVYGKFLFEIGEDKTSSIQAKQVNFGNDKYTFTYATDLSYGSADEDGLTGCDVMNFISLHAPGASTSQPIYLNTDKYDSPDLKWKSEKFDNSMLMLVSGSEGGADEITEVSSTIFEEAEALRIAVTYFYQDGSSNGRIYVGRNDGKFEVIGYEYDPIEY